MHYYVGPYYGIPFSQHCIKNTRIECDFSLPFVPCSQHLEAHLKALSLQLLLGDFTTKGIEGQSRIFFQWSWEFLHKSSQKTHALFLIHVQKQ